MRQRPTAERLRKIYLLGSRTAPDPIKAQVPLAEHGRGVALLPEISWHREPARFDQRTVITLRHPLFQSAAPGVATRQQSIATGRANPRGRMRVGETQPLTRELIEVRRRPSTIGIIAGDIAHPEIIRQDVENIRRRSGVRTYHQKP